ncbi:MAG TPA: hypothetical protein VFT32_06710 [Candidatus Eisenbacteria bacterium]|nr:hypothetical protein [Candidatus Eisenbacteria bacterium]
MRIAAALLALPLLGCLDWNDAHTPGGGGPPLPHIGIPPIVASGPDQFSVVPLGPISNDTYSYSWSCSAPQANLAIAGVSGGAIRIEIEDDAGATVHDNWFDGGLVGAITAMTAPDGAPGDWRIRLTFSGVLSIGAIDIHADVFDDPDEITIAGSYALQSSYEFQAGWPAGPAKVTIASAIALGTVRVRMWDGDGDLVLDRTNLAIFIGLSDGHSHSGAAGTWTIRIDIDAVATAGAITIDHP